MHETEPQWDATRLNQDEIDLLNLSEDNRRAKIEAMSVGDANILVRKLGKEIDRCENARRSAARGIASVRATLLSV